MLFVRDKGRLCNNILQYGHVYAWGAEHGVRTVSMRFAYKYQYFRICHSRHHSFFTYLLAKTLGKLHLIRTLKFHDENADYSSNEQVMKSALMAIVEGWYVRYYDLFLKYKQDIISLFSFDRKVTQNVDRIISGDSADVRLGVHIRRGDYKTFQNGKYYYEDDVFIDYIRHFVKLHEGKSVAVYICGNDPYLDKERYEATFATGNTKVSFPCGNPAEDLYLLSECDYLIGPPSTFTLVASMYRNIPLLWMHDSDASSTERDEAWGYFDELFKQII